MRTSFHVCAAVAAALCVSVSTASLAAGSPAPLSNGLRELAAAYDRGDPQLQQKLQVHLTDRTGNPLVKIRIQPGANVNAVLAKLAAAGFQLQVRSSINPSMVEGYLPLSLAHNVAAVAGVHSIHAEHVPMKNAGSVQSQAVALEKADIAQKHGFDGKGIRIGALSDSYDSCATCTIHAADDIKTGDLPKEGVTVLQELPLNAGGEDEGRAMLQLIHDIAPGAKLGFATASTGEIQFGENILTLRSKFKADVIVDDVFYFDEPMYSDGLLSQAVNLAVQSGAAYFSSAGNNGLMAFEDNYNAIPFAKAKALVAAGRGNVKLEQIPPALRPKSIHNFGTFDGAAITQRVSVAAIPAVVSFQWDEPFNVGGVKTDYNIYIFDKDGNWIDGGGTGPVTYSTDDNTQTDQAVEIAHLVPNPADIVAGVNITDYQIVIGNMNDGPAKRLKYIVLNALAPSERQDAPSTYGHSTATGAMSVAAMYYAIPQFPEDFSAQGPATILFDQNGNRLATPDVRFKPQITAADGVDTTFFGGTDPDATGHPNFFGTSAAAPDAAAVGALVLQAAGGPGSLSPQRLYQRLTQTATRVPVPNERAEAAAVSGPVFFSINGDFTRWNRNFSVNVPLLLGHHFVKSITLDTSPLGLQFNPNLNRFSVGESTGISAADITPSVNAAATQFTLTFKDGKLGNEKAFDFGLSVFAPIQGATHEDPDRFRGMRVIVTLDNGQVFNTPVISRPKVPVNNFTGFGLINADTATRDHGGR